METTETMQEDVGLSHTTLQPPEPVQASSPLSPPPDDTPSPNVVNLSIHSSPRKRSSTPEDSTTTTTIGGDTTMTNGGPAKKRAKLTDAEKEEKEKERVEKQKEKDAKEKERFAKKAEKDEKKRLKDEEKKKKEEELARKEKAQPRLNAFFKMPAGASTAPKSVPSPSKPQAAAPEVPDKTDDNSAPSPSPLNTASISDYEKHFQPFFVKPHVTMSGPHNFLRDEMGLSSARKAIEEAVCHDKGTDTGNDDDAMEIDVPASKDVFAVLLHIPSHKRRQRGRIIRYTTKQILSALNASPEPVIDLTSDTKANGEKPDYLTLLKTLPKKHLHFAEDVRPPYRGTFTQTPTVSSLRRGRNPFLRGLPGIDYDYDSEAEWIEAPEEDEGEELLSEDEDDTTSVADVEDMEDFLDDEADDLGKANKRNAALGPLIPINTGMIWKDEHESMARWEHMRIGLLLENITAPINPFSTEYWPKKERQKPAAPKVQPTSAPTNPVSNTLITPFVLSDLSNPANPVNTASMPPPRPPLEATKNGATKSNKPKALISDADMSDFRRAVEGSDLTKTGLIEVLKKQFPKSSKEAIRETLSTIAARVGSKEADKRWVLLPTS